MTLSVTVAVVVSAFGATFVMPSSVQRVADIDYVGGGLERQRLDLYLPKTRADDDPLPVVCWVHGGGWGQGSRSRPRALTGLLETGRYVGVSIGYRLSDEAKWPAQLHDCKAAIRWVRANAGEYGIDADRIGVWGASAGGHLVAMLGVCDESVELEGDLGPHAAVSSRVRCVVDWFGPTDLRAMDAQGSTIVHDGAESPESRLIGEPIQQAPVRSATASPIAFASSDDAPMLIVHGTRDALVPYEQSVELLHALRAAKAPVAMLTVVGAGHGGFGPVAQSLSERFLESHLIGPPVDWADASIAAPQYTPPVVDAGR